MTSHDVINIDIEYIYDNCREGLSHFAGENILITGGAGFLGYYLLQSILFWNRVSKDYDHVRLIVMDNFIRGVPSWLMQLKSEKNLKIIKNKR